MRKMQRDIYVKQSQSKVYGNYKVERIIGLD